MTSRKTTHVRTYKDTIKEMELSFPNMRKADLIKLSWDTSLLKLEGNMKKKDLKNKFGKILWGNTWDDLK